jgi:hypothetical protein
MNTAKRVLCPERLRRVPRAFSWVDHRLVRDGHISRIGHEAQGLYLFLVTVSDAEGLSYYSDTKAAQLLNMSASALCLARRELLGVGLIAYCRPLYQVLGLDDPHVGVPAARPVQPRRGSDEAISIGDALRQVLGGAQ